MLIQRRSSGQFATSLEPVQQAPASDVGDDGSQPAESGAKSRPMRGAELMGSRRHTTSNGHSVLIVKRDGKYLARGRYEGHQFGVTLGSDAESAAQRLRRVLVELEDNTSVPGREAQRNMLSRGQVPNCDLRSLANCYLADVRQRRGIETARDYRNRLLPILDFAETPDARRRWPKAQKINREFGLRVHAYLRNLDIRRNGKPGGPVKKMSEKHVRNCLETLRGVLSWGSRTDVRQLPPAFQNPITPEILGPTPSKDPLRGSAIPLHKRLELVALMDPWQLLHLSLLIILPIRPEDVSGALISDLEENGETLRLGTRLGGSDFNKGRVTVLMPLPTILQRLFQSCASGRTEQPLFRSRVRYERDQKHRRLVCSQQTISACFEDELRNAPKDEIQSERDRKRVFRQMLRKIGGITKNEIGKNLAKLLRQIGLPERIRPYDLRHSITPDMHRAEIQHLEMRYLTLHRIDDILNCYTGLEPKREMAKYYKLISPLLDAIEFRAKELGLLPTDNSTTSRKLAE